MNRLRAAATHFVASAAILLAVLGLMQFVWYPAPYFATESGWKAWGILAGVVMVLGPLLTLIVFKPGKPGLKFDLICIVLAQLVALFYGGHIIYQQRPTFVVFGVDRFTAVPAADVDFAQLRYPELKHAIGIGIGPILAEAKSPDDPKKRQELLFDVLGGQKDIEFRAELYEPYRPDPQQLRSRGIDLSKIAARSADARRAIEVFLARRGGRLEDYLYLPLRGKNVDIVMVLSPKDGFPMDSIPISPWLEDYR